MPIGGSGSSEAKIRLSIVPRARLRTLAAKVKKRSQNKYQAGIVAKKSMAVKILMSLTSDEVEEEFWLTAVESTLSHPAISTSGFELAYDMAVESSTVNLYTAEKGGRETCGGAEFSETVQNPIANTRREGCNT